MPSCVTHFIKQRLSDIFNTITHTVIIMDKITNNPVAEFMGKATETTMDYSEKTVQALDPLHLFAPNTANPTRLILPKGLFDFTEDYPILHARSNDPFHDLIVKQKTNDDELVFEDASTHTQVLVMERTPKPRMYDICKTSPMADGQAVSRNSLSGAELYLRAKVLMSGDKGDMKVFMSNETDGDDATYTITKAPGLLNFSTQKVIMMKGVEKPVASTSEWQDGTYMVEIMPSVDAGLMMCLAIAADDVTE